MNELALQGRGAAEIPVVAILNEDCAALQTETAALEALGLRLSCHSQVPLLLSHAHEFVQRPGCTIFHIGDAIASGLAAVKQLTSADRLMLRQMIIVSDNPSVSMTIDAMQNHAWTLLERPFETSTLQATVMRACRISVLRCAELAERRLRAKRWQSLTKDEQLIAELILQGLPNKTIGARMDVSLRTVESRRQNIFRKFGVKTVVELAFELAQLAAHEKVGFSLEGAKQGNGRVDTAHSPH